MSRFSGGGNWYGVKNRYAYQRQVAELKSVPTQQQKKYYEFLVKKCEDNGVTPMLVRSEHRTEYAYQIKHMRNKLVGLGIDIHWDGKPKYRYDKFGNVIEIATGKIVKKG